MLGSTPVIGFLATTDSARARAFYQEVLGLRVVEEHAFALVLDAAGTMLRVQKVDALTPQPFTALGWKVDDLAATITALAGRGVAFVRYPFFEQDALGVWTAPDGVKVAWFKDPDGNLLSLSQHA